MSLLKAAQPLSVPSRRGLPRTRAGPPEPTPRPPGFTASARIRPDPAGPPPQRPGRRGPESRWPFSCPENNDSGPARQSAYGRLTGCPRPTRQDPPPDAVSSKICKANARIMAMETRRPTRRPHRLHRLTAFSRGRPKRPLFARERPRSSAGVCWRRSRPPARVAVDHPRGATANRVSLISTPSWPSRQHSAVSSSTSSVSP